MRDIILKQRSIFVHFFYLLPILFFIGGCDDSTSVKQIDDLVIPSANVLFSKHIQPVLTIKCASSGCHDESNKGNIKLLDYFGVMNSDPILVFPRLPQSSRLIWIIKYTVPHTAVFIPFTANQIAGFETWIKEGALYKESK